MNPSPGMEDREHHAALLRLDNSIHPRITDFVGDPAFVGAWHKLDMEGFAREFNAFSAKIPSYTTFHTRERRLWAIKLGRGSIPKDVEAAFIETIPSAIHDYRIAFESIARCITLIEGAGFKEVLNRRLSNFTSDLADEERTFGRTVTSYFRQIGCSTPMLDEFRSKHRITNFDLINTLGKGDFSNLRGVMHEAVEAQAQVLEYTKKNGFSYLRGRCGPPAWAIVVSELLGWFGISISAWAVVAVIASLVALIIIICLLKVLPADIQSKCDFVKFALNLQF